MKVLATIFYLISAILTGMGFHKMFVYSNSEYFSSNVNAYVGGDAYNYIINSNYATAFFILSLIFVILGSTMLIMSKINSKSSEQSTEPKETVQ